MRNYEKELEDLKNGVVDTIEVDKNEFYDLREFLVKREDFKHFRGIAKQGGRVIYEYLEVGRS